MEQSLKPANAPAAEPDANRAAARPFEFEAASGPEMFAGAGSPPPDDARLNPAFFERIPLMEVTEATLARGRLLHPEYYRKHGRFFIAEAGTYRGRGLLAVLEVARKLDTKVLVYGLDSFEGLPPLSKKDAKTAPADASYRTRTLFADVTEREIHAYIGPEHASSYKLVKGFFDQTLATLPKQKYLMAIIDCDLYSSHMDCMGYFYDRLLPGGVMFFDDYNSSHYPMAKMAVDDFLASKPEKLMYIGYGTPRGNNVKTYIVKT